MVRGLASAHLTSWWSSVLVGLEQRSTGVYAIHKAFQSTKGASSPERIQSLCAGTEAGGLSLEGLAGAHGEYQSEHDVIGEWDGTKRALLMRLFGEEFYPAGTRSLFCADINDLTKQK